ncbi:DUF397 domain-containing protein [Actinomadura sp. 9N407]|uniref:DUF397 domain-containing protein n=1 Tax=Actinomadura sp. 9N407 TaxID=3375154 RepID=UPI0037B14D40
MSSPSLSSTTWRKSSHSNGAGGACVEVAALSTSIGVRDSKAPDAGHLKFGPQAWATFITQVRNGRHG